MLRREKYLFVTVLLSFLLSMNKFKVGLRFFECRGHFRTDDWMRECVQLGSWAALLSYMSWGCEPPFCSLSTECLMIQPLNTTTPDNNLDVLISLLAFGLYPNVCYHKEKRKILGAEGHNAFIHKSSVSCPFSRQDIKYPSPFFVFGEKVRSLNFFLSMCYQVA